MLGGLGDGPLTEDVVERHLRPLFSKTLAADGIYLANHSLGRPMDQMALDVQEACQAWQSQLDVAWNAWFAEISAYRARLAALMGAPRADCVAPKTAAGQGLRAVLNALPGKPHVATTRGEFDSVDVILKQYATRGRITLEFVEPSRLAATRADLVVVSQVMFMTSEIVPDLQSIAAAVHKRGGYLLVDVYHSMGVIPVDVTAMDADFAIGASYKYLRGGPGAGYLYVAPRVLESDFKPLDTGWFAKDEPFAFERPDPPRFAEGGDAYLESTPPVLTYYQARSGQQFNLAVGVTRMRPYVLDRLVRLKSYLAEAGVKAEGGDAQHGAFLTVRHPKAMELWKTLATRGVRIDSRADVIRFAPDCLTRDEEMREAARAAAEVIGRA